MKFILTILFISAFHSFSWSQFVTIGDAEPMGGSCIKLTNDYPFSEGIAYSSSKLDLTQNFQIEFDIYLGDKDSYGADGITFVIHNDKRGFASFGTFGEFLGYGGRNSFGSAFIAPSIAIEFDTYQNMFQNDPFSDHVAFLENGINKHQNVYTGNEENWNLEDDQLHGFRFSWNPESKKIKVFLDEKLAYQGKKDLLGETFNGQKNVIWGFTASTGRKHNLQYFCFLRLASGR